MGIVLRLVGFLPLLLLLLLLLLLFLSFFLSLLMREERVKMRANGIM